MIKIADTIFQLNSQTNLSYSTFQAVFLETLNKIAPVKVKVLRFNNNAFMTKSLRKAIMLRSRLKNNFNKGLNCKCNSKKMLHRDYKRFDQKKFETELKLKFTNKLKLLYFLSCVPRNFKQDCTS